MTVPVALASAVTALLAYLLGSANLAVIFSKKMFGHDVRTHGSGNAGSTNMLRTFGWKAAALTFFGDVAKGARRRCCSGGPCSARPSACPGLRRLRQLHRRHLRAARTYVIPSIFVLRAERASPPHRRGGGGLSRVVRHRQRGRLFAGRLHGLRLGRLADLRGGIPALSARGDADRRPVSIPSSSRWPSPWADSSCLRTEGTSNGC
jgi:hypothetical protein